MRVPFLVASLLLLGSSVARAEGALENVSVVVSRRAAESLACTSPKASLYLQGTLRDIAERRWGMVTTSLQSDTADLIADAVYESVRTGQSDVFASFEGHDETTCASPLSREIITDVDRCVHRPLAERRRDPACALAAAVRGALDGDVPTARLNMADLIAVSTFDGVYTGAHLSEGQKDRLFEHVATELRAAMTAPPVDDGPDEDDPRARAESSELDPACQDGDLLRALSDAALDPHARFCAATRPDMLDDTVAVKITGPSGEVRTTTLAGLLHGIARTHGAAAPEVAEAILCEAPLAVADRPDCTGGAFRSPRGGTFKLTIAETTWNLVVANGHAKAEAPRGGRSRALGAVIEGAQHALGARARLGALVRDQLGEEPPADAVRELAIAGLRARRLAATFRGEEHRADILGPIEALYGDLACDAPRTPLERIRCIPQAPRLRKLVIAAEDGRIRELASRVSMLLTPRASTCSARAGARLLAGFAANIPDVQSSAHDDAIALEQLHGAAAELGRCTPDESDPRFSLSIVPSPALRFSWNGAYYNAWGSDGFRIVPSLDMLSARLRLSPAASGVRVAAILSAVDLFAPFGELAMRRSDLHYDRQNMLWLDAVRPRLDVAFGVPAIARHFRFVAGLAMRTVAPYRGGDGKPANSATYLTVGTSGGATAESFASYVEYSLGAKYLF